jgi:hypothetical protein
MLHSEVISSFRPGKVVNERAGETELTSLDMCAKPRPSDTVGLVVWTIYPDRSGLSPGFCSLVFCALEGRSSICDGFPSSSWQIVQLWLSGRLVST